MHKITFFPLGNADCCRIDLSGGKKLLFDYAATRDKDDDDDPRIDLPSVLREDLESSDRDQYEVVAFTHLDKDHYQGASEFFWLDHAKRYQDEDRIKIETMWVPAAVITETSVEDAEGRIIQAEARYRLKQGSGIRVFSRPERLRKWLEGQGLKLEERQHLITDAGNVIPGFSKTKDGIEFFVHSPFAKRIDEDILEDRNEGSLVVQATFQYDNVDTKLFLAADAEHDVLTDIVEITEAKGRNSRLEWDVFKLPHHCSYLSLGPEKGEDQTEPVDEVKRLFEERGQDSSVIVSTSKPIPKKGSEEDKDANPPHRQAAKYYDSVRKALDGEFLVTMEHPRKESPEPIVIEVDEGKATVQKRAAVGGAATVTRRAPRAG